MEMAHALHGYDGLCKNIHGHSYRLWVTIIGEVLQEKDNVKNGMVLDFSLLKKIVKPDIVDKYDHSLVLNANSPHADIDLSAFEKVFLLPYQPTSENLVYDFAMTIQKKLPENISLYKVVLSETATSFAEWCAEDNE
jgi:6-pyruvoyltetrahydropterin/6-carboxytetrahydropterin synthase